MARYRFVSRSAGSFSFPTPTAVLLGPASVVIEQNRLKHRLHVAPHSLAVVVKTEATLYKYPRARIARDQSLDQLAAVNLSHVRVVENGVERLLQILLARCPAGMTAPFRIVFAS